MFDHAQVDILVELADADVHQHANVTRAPAVDLRSPSSNIRMFDHAQSQLCELAGMTTYADMRM